MLLSSCTNARYLSRPVPAKGGGRVRIRPMARLADSTESRASLTTYGVSVVTSFAYLLLRTSTSIRAACTGWNCGFCCFYFFSFSFPLGHTSRANGMDKACLNALQREACCGSETTLGDLRCVVWNPVHGLYWTDSVHGPSANMLTC